jgi:hypothetical protein
MSESQFRQRVQNEFRKVPLATRQAWNGNDVAAWWFEQVKAHPGIEHGSGSVDHWQAAHGAVIKMYGTDTVI